MPISGHSWSQIWGKLPYLTICSVIMAFISNQVTNELIKREIMTTMKAKKRIAEREKFYSAPNTHECRICGYHNEDYPWGTDGKCTSYKQ